uniref:Phospholipid-transporting ATPase n=1 Tax=Leptobrachium leishanense TaxID=445787 RepID=A0A8C5P6N5_9ANUR
LWFCVSGQNLTDILRVAALPSDNSITTSKYNIITFIPLNLFEQFHRLANIYFLFIIILQVIPAISTVPWFAIMLPLLFLLVVRGVKDLIDDIVSISLYNLHLMSKKKSFCSEKWKDIQVGDIVRLQKDDFVPADLLLLYSLEPNSLCFVETADIDGETNLKFKQASMVTHKLLCTEESMAAFDGKVTCEESNSNMHSFTGTLEWNSEKYSLDNDHILLRGCRIRNTKTCYGLVIYAGVDSKIMKNCGKVRIKKTKLDLMMNKLVVIIFGFLVSFSLLLAIIAGFWAKTFQEKHSYIPPLTNNISPAYSAFLIFWGYIILMSTIVPMSMYITLEFIHLIHSMFIDWDVEMYFPENDTPAKARSTSLSDLLGQVEYVFSDKTGTLTQNVMTFKKCCINARIYETQPLWWLDFAWNKYADKKFCFYDKSLIDTVQQNEDETLKEFFRLLAICHTVMVDQNRDELIYQAASPDEEALVTAARNFGYVFLSRTQDSITTNELGVERTYKVLAILDFNSVRKRMSVLVIDPEGRIKLYTKGADDVILQRLHQDCTDNEITEKSLEMFGKETLRTLCIAYKEVDISFYTNWNKRYHEASVSLQNRAENLEMVYEEIETNLKLLGATAIEDKLQDLVPETIQLLKDGNIKVWVLTGDKQETAINIGFSCKLLSEEMEILDENQIWYDKLVNKDFGRLFRTLSVKQDKSSIMKRMADTFYRKEPTQYHTEESLREWAFVDLASRCQAVICCRVTPKQKSMIVQLVKKYKQVTTLAIGDGANDVNMIKTADIGVGISGLEGTQFCYLQRLLFVHGRWSYLRITKFLRYFFYKTVASVLNHIWFAFFNGFTALMVYDSWFIAFYSVNFTAYPVLFLGLLEQDVSAKLCLKIPELYKVGQSGALFTYKTFCWSFLKGVITSLVTFFFAYGAFLDTSGPDGVCDYQVFTVTIATAVILAVTLEIMFDITYWTLLSGLAILISIVKYFLLTLLVQTYPLFKAMPTMFSFLGKVNNYNLCFCWETSHYSHNILPLILQKDFYMANKKLEVATVAMTTAFKRGSARRRSSYAFSHKEGYADLITRGTSLRRSKEPNPDALNIAKTDQLFFFKKKYVVTLSYFFLESANCKG